MRYRIMSENKKYFLDLNGLTHLWNKIKSNFADKSTTESNILDINNNLNVINEDITEIRTDISNTNSNIDYNSPKETDTYSTALELAKYLRPGVIIKVNRSERKENSIFVAGFYVVESIIPASIKYIGTSSGAIEDDDILKLKDRVSNLESSVIKEAVYTDNNTEIPYDIIDNKLIIKYDNKYIANSESVNALTHRAIAAKFGELEATISRIPKFNIEVVDELPTHDISPYTIYLVKNFAQSNKNLYTEYIYIERSSTVWEWEKLGEQTLDLSDYITKTEVELLINNAISELVTKSELENTITNTKQEIQILVNDQIENKTKDFINIDDFDSLLIDSITVGSAGDEIRIPPEQIREIINKLNNI